MCVGVKYYVCVQRVHTEHAAVINESHQWPPIIIIYPIIWIDCRFMSRVVVRAFNVSPSFMTVRHIILLHTIV